MITNPELFDPGRLGPGITLQNNGATAVNLGFAAPASFYSSARCRTPHAPGTGRWYAEFRLVAGSTAGDNSGVGIGNANANAFAPDTFFGGDANSWGFYPNAVSHNPFVQAPITTPYPPQQGSIMSVCWDSNTGNLYFLVDGIGINGTLLPGTPTFTGVSGVMYLGASLTCDGPGLPSGRVDILPTTQYMPAGWQPWGQGIRVAPSPTGVVNLSTQFGRDVVPYIGGVLETTKVNP